MLALLAARFGAVDLADDAVQDALLQAVSTWAEQGVPDNPAGWLHTVARNKIVDALRRREAAERRLRAATVHLGQDQVAGPDLESDPEPELIREDRLIGDEQLRLMLLCCHPSLDQDTQVALTLRLVGGLSTAEIAAAFLLPEATLAQRIVRAKRKIRAARIPLSVPADLRVRVDALLSALYLVFNEGYLSQSMVADGLCRVDLSEEAIRLTALASRLLPQDGEILGLLALQRFQHARLAARVDAAGDLVTLADQDRRLWDAEGISAGRAALQEAVGCEGLGSYRLQALIAAIHTSAPSSAETDWRSIVVLYRILERVSPGPVVTLNRAIAVAEVDGASSVIAEVEAIEGLGDYYLWHAARGELHLRLGDRVAAHAAFATARSLAKNPAERRHLDRRVTYTAGKHV
ncbi:sigma-70 family RNA polymerase sigma factor [Herbiconiux moechotypicola]|uniref:RNA polymerase sigma factor n=1 Tax=Herbiconiux moechotypicola TaxID=637393 RepID=A0ABP5Q9Q3_9MICO|nr:sigma-70 family RNA polymerase sigma factor [Herbiconiux moechotypicola]MCS5729412.1 sigma-70 family RNA polymerase sigma factor [Herbiconiux moechotypicola]